MTEGATTTLEAVEVGIRRGHRAAVDGVSLSLGPGDCLGVAGPNAAGKSTLLAGLAGWLPLAAGSVRVCGRPVRFGHVPLETGFAMQDPAFYETRSGRDNLRLVGALYGLRGPDLERRVGELAERFSLGAHLDRPAATYSGGYARRLHLALAVIHRPRLLLLDEPTVGLDPSTRRALLDVVNDLLGDGTAVVVTSQVLDDLEAVSTAVMVLVEGRTVLHEQTRELMGRLATGRIVIQLADHPRADLRLDPREVAGVVSWSLEHDRLRLRVREPHQTLAAVLAWLDRHGLLAASIEVQPPNLDQVLAELVPTL